MPDRIGDRVRRARLSAGLTQQELAREVGISQPYLSYLENGERPFNEDTLLKVSRALGLSVGTLVDKEESAIWQRGFDAGVLAARRALESLHAGGPSA